MNMKKYVKKAFFFLFIAVFFPLYAQEAKDVVLVVDTSSSMFSVYNEVGTYLSGPFLSENLALGDVLHIISFGSRPRIEIARRVMGQGDIETAVARIWLLYPLSPASDSAAALNYSEQYVRSMPGGRPKKVFIVSDNDLSAQVEAAAARIRPAAELFFIRASSRMGGTLASAGTAGQNQGTGSPGTTGGNIQGTVPPGTVSPGTGSNTPGTSGISDTPGDSPPDTTGSGGQQDPADDPVNRQPDNQNNTETGREPGQMPNITENTTNRNAVSAGGLSGFFLPLLIGAGLLVLFLIIFFILRARRGNASRSGARREKLPPGSVAASRDADMLNSYASHQAAAALQGPVRYNQSQSGSGSQVLTEPPTINMFVEFQSAAIGKRNVHTLKKGNIYTVGGGNSDFLIFLVSVPPRIGQLTFDGTSCTFRPLRPEFFPDLGSTPVHECLGKTIRLLSSKNYELFFHFERYVDPLVALNQLLHSINNPDPRNYNS